MVDAGASPTAGEHAPEQDRLPMSSEERIGRDAEFGELLAAWHDARSGRGRAVLVTGDAGMGKTQLLHDLARRCADGATVIETMCPPGDGAPPLWPWIEMGEAARRLLDGTGPGDEAPGWPVDATGAAGAGGGDRGGNSGAPPPAVLGTEDRYRLYDRFVRLFAEAAAGGPLLVLLDDLHWADSASIELLTHLVPRLRSLPILLLTAGRADEGAGARVTALAADHASAWLGIHLAGLDHEHLALLLSRLTGHDPVPERLVAAVDRHTGGNPFFVREVLRLVVAEGRLETAMTGGSALPVPDTVQAVLLRRIAGRSGRCRDTLALMAVAGPEADLQLLATALGEQQDDVTAALDEAVAARLVTSPPTCRMAHDLIRGAVYDSLEPATRRVHHATIARALEERSAVDDSRATTAALARHWMAALPDGDPGKAAHHSARAGAHASEVFAHTEAVRQYRNALTALDLVDGDLQAERLRVQLALGDALQRSGDAAAAEEAFAVALASARRLDDTAALAHAALGLAGPLEVGRSRPAVTAALEEALDRCGDESGPIEARIRARLGLALLFSDSADRRRPLVDEALAMARATGDVDALATALFAWHIVGWTPDNAGERIAVAEELCDLAAAPGRSELAMWGRFRLLRDHAELGDFAAVDREIAAQDRLVDELHQPIARWFVLMNRSMREMVRGRFAESEELATEAVTLGEPVVGELAGLCFGGAGIPIRMWQGRLDELEAGFREAAELLPNLPSVRCSLALILTETGRHDEARTQLEQLSEDGFGRIGRNSLATVEYVLLAHVATRLGAIDHATRLYELLEPMRGTCAVGSFAEFFHGAVDLQLGMLASTAGRDELAGQHFTTALQMHRRMGARPALAQTQIEYAATLTAVDPARARELLDEAVRTCEALGMPTWADRASAALATLPARHDRSAADEPAVNRFRRDGHVWRVGYGGSDALVDDSKGMRDLAQLLAHPGRDIHVLELSAATEGHVTPVRRRDEDDLHTTGPPDEILDATARDAYRDRIAELEAELADAEDMGDPERAARARVERDLLVDELAAAVGLGGRGRRHRDDDERARQAVTARIRYACNKLAGVDRPLADHLTRSVRTGRFCSYSPETPVDWQL